jgi:single-strand DNA-binding protein
MAARAQQGARGSASTVGNGEAGPRYVNSIELVGRLSAVGEARELPSGDRVLTCRIVIPREGDGPGETGVDTIDVACWTRATQAAVARIGVDGFAQVTGILRRRFFRTGAGPASRYEVEARTVRRVATGQRSRAKLADR